MVVYIIPLIRRIDIATVAKPLTSSSAVIAKH